MIAMLIFTVPEERKKGAFLQKKNQAMLICQLVDL